MLEPVGSDDTEPVPHPHVPRCALVCVLCVCSCIAFAVSYREAAPFVKATTNLLAYVAQYAVLLTFAGALAIEVGTYLEGWQTHLLQRPSIVLLSTTTIYSSGWLQCEASAEPPRRSTNKESMTPQTNTADS